MGWTKPILGRRGVRFSELLIFAIESGCRLNLVTNNDHINKAFEERLNQYVDDNELLRVVKSPKLHTKGLLTPEYFLAIYEFTYSGTHKNEEQVVLNIDKDTILEAKLEFEDLYGVSQMDNHVSSFCVGNNWDLTKIIEGNYPKPLQNYLSDMLSLAKINILLFCQG